VSRGSSYRFVCLVVWLFIYLFTCLFICLFYSLELCQQITRLSYFSQLNFHLIQLLNLSNTVLYLKFKNNIICVFVVLLEGYYCVFQVDVEEEMKCMTWYTATDNKYQSLMFIQLQLIEN